MAESEEKAVRLLPESHRPPLPGSSPSGRDYRHLVVATIRPLIATWDAGGQAIGFSFRAGPPTFARGPALRHTRRTNPPALRPDQARGAVHVRAGWGCGGADPLSGGGGGPAGQCPGMCSETLGGACGPRPGPHDPGRMRWAKGASDIPHPAHGPGEGWWRIRVDGVLRLAAQLPHAASHPGGGPHEDPGKGWTIADRLRPRMAGPGSASGTGPSNLRISTRPPPGAPRSA